ncbi:hypothetical protein GCM10009415_04860 [Chitinophaga japonensis]
MPYGRQHGQYVYARTLRDSTIYAIDVRTADSRPYAAGMFNNTDSITLELTKGLDYIITAAAFKKGSGHGLWYEMTGGLQRFGYPFNRTLENKMVYNVTDSFFMANLDYTQVFASDSTNAYAGYFPELDSYMGTVNFSPDSAQTLDIPLKRIVFGLQFNVVNFNDGKLIVQYENYLPNRSYTPQDISNSLGIYTGNAFRWIEELNGANDILTLKWERTDGNVYTLGSKTLPAFKRNYITTVNVTLPTDPSTVNNGVSITLSDTTWTSSNTVDF